MNAWLELECMCVFWCVRRWPRTRCGLGGQGNKGTTHSRHLSGCSYILVNDRLDNIYKTLNGLQLVHIRLLRLRPTATPGTCAGL